ncbi:hypothetical protein [Streptomyces tendae]|uniref:hypothetical protein n=1 Tax=Streptomyces tendae TaxID=1932 RepID=UPI0030B8FDA1
MTSTQSPPVFPLYEAVRQAAPSLTVDSTQSPPSAPPYEEVRRAARRGKRVWFECVGRAGAAALHRA